MTVARDLKLPLAGAAFLLAAIFIGAWSGADDARLARGAPLSGPTMEFWLGTNAIGQDIFWRMLAGGRQTLLVAIPAALLALGIGTLLGLIGADRRGWVDAALVTTANAFGSIPFYLWAGVMVTALGASPAAVTVAIASAYWVGVFRVVRAEARRLEATGFVQAARLLGRSRWSVMREHQLPAVSYLALTQAGLLVAAAVKVEVGVSFLGLGGADSISWGTMLAEGSRDLGSGHGWNAIAAGSAVLCFLYLVNVLTDRVQQRGKERSDDNPGR